MKKLTLGYWVLFFSMLLIPCQVFSQAYSVKSKKAIEYYRQARGAFIIENKISLLQKAIQKEKKFIEAYWLLAETYESIDSLNYAITVLQSADNLNLANVAETKCRLSELYFSIGDYESALFIINQVREIYYKDKTDILRTKYENAIYLKSNPVVFTPKNLVNVNTNFDDYFPSITADGQMISTTVLAPALNDGFERKQEDIYVSFLRDNEWSYSTPLPPPMNTQGNEGSQSFSVDGRYMFFVLCDNRENIGSCDIYYSIRQGKEWSRPINLGEPANSRYWESNPVMSPTGDMIYFTTNRPGGLGSMDIWSVSVKIMNDGTLKTFNARPLGAPVNTPKAEFAPFIHADNKTLYFSSDGHNGLGGNDIYVTRKQDDGSWSEPMNLGYPINTNGDESGFVVNGLGDKAYFASNNIVKNNRGLDIYEIELPVHLRPKPMLYSPGRVYNSITRKPIEARVEIFDRSTNINCFESLSDRATGEFIAVLPADGVYGLSVQAADFLFFTAYIDQPGDSILVDLNPIKQGSATTLDNLFFDHDSANILAESNAEIERLYEFLIANSTIKIEIVGHTDNVGDDKYNLNLSSRRANALRDELVRRGISSDRISAVGKGSSMPVASNDNEKGRAKNRRVEVIIL